MTLEEAIKREEELADGHDRIKQIKAVTLEECRRAEEHQQLAEWLKDYQRLLEEQQVEDAKKHFEIICKLSQVYGMPYSFVEEKIKETEKALLKKSPQEPCGDAISRQAAIDVIDALYLDGDSSASFQANADGDALIGKYQAITALDDLPPVTPQPEMGRWIDIMVGDMPAQACDQCNAFYPLAYTGGGHKFCPNCGRKMQEVLGN